MIARGSSKPGNELPVDSSTELDPAISTLSQDQQHMFAEVLNIFVPWVWEAEWIKKTAKYAADLAQIDNQVSPRQDDKSLVDWTYVLLKGPDFYIRMIWTIDLCIGRGRLPQESDFPPWLRTHITAVKMAAKKKLEQHNHLPSPETTDSELLRITEL